MGPARMLRPLRSAVQVALPHLHGHQINGLTHACFAMVRAEHCQLSRMGVATPGAARAPSSERRWQRLIANERLDPHATLDHWARSSLAGVHQVTLLLDETARDGHLRAMKLSRQLRGRAVPLLWRCYQPDALPMNERELVLDLLHRAAAAMPDKAQVTLMADRGLSWPAVLDACVKQGWHYVLRVQGQTRVLLDDGQEMALRDLAPRRGSQWCGCARVFKKAGWRRTNVVACWRSDEEEPWLLITDLPATGHRCRQYRKRMRQEQAFRDEKSQGFRWRQSRVNDPDHAQRLLLIMALAMAWLLWLGCAVINRGWRCRLERRDRRTLSIFQLGLRWLIAREDSSRPPPCGKCVGR
jgi:hypothetical protein